MRRGSRPARPPVGATFPCLGRGVQCRYNPRQVLASMSAIRWKRGPSMAVKVVVESVRINLATNTRVVLLKDAKIDRYLLIHIGEWESFAIAAELQGHKPTRPFTHDLVMNMLGQLDARIESILI